LAGKAARYTPASQRRFHYFFCARRLLSGHYVRAPLRRRTAARGASTFQWPLGSHLVWWKSLRPHPKRPPFRTFIPRVLIRKTPPRDWIRHSLKRFQSEPSVSRDVICATRQCRWLIKTGGVETATPRPRQPFLSGSQTKARTPPGMITSLVSKGEPLSAYAPSICNLIETHARRNFHLSLVPYRNPE